MDFVSFNVAIFITSLYENQFPTFKCIDLDFLMGNLFSIKHSGLLHMKVVSFDPSQGSKYYYSFYKL